MVVVGSPSSTTTVTFSCSAELDGDDFDQNLSDTSRPERIATPPHRSLLKQQRGALSLTLKHTLSRKTPTTPIIVSHGVAREEACKNVHVYSSAPMVVANWDVEGMGS
uniref:Uncharacterized protein n=1 Tax=Echinococcus granulosus TaxID=6210 RepID=A0A068X4Z6_ECHGR|nr:hypothetical protein EgrG_002052100 [Echinococcus granulosus]